MGGEERGGGGEQEMRGEDSRGEERRAEERRGERDGDKGSGEERHRNQKGVKLRSKNN